MNTDVNQSHPCLADALSALPSASEVPACAPARQAPLTSADVLDIAELIGIDFAMVPFSAEELQLGLEMELEHERFGHLNEVVDEDLVMSGMLALAHLQRRHDYYTQISQAHSPGDRLTDDHLDVGAD